MDKHGKVRLSQKAMSVIKTSFPYLEGVEGLARQLGISKYHLIHCFREDLDCTPGDYLQRIRVFHARLLLANRDYSVETIAEMVGFSSSGYFGKVFRKATGETPSDYRNNHRDMQLSLEEIQALQALENQVHL